MEDMARPGRQESPVLVTLLPCSVLWITGLQKKHEGLLPSLHMTVGKWPQQASSSSKNINSLPVAVLLSSKYSQH